VSQKTHEARMIRRRELRNHEIQITKKISPFRVFFFRVFAFLNLYVDPCLIRDGVAAESADRLKLDHEKSRFFAPYLLLAVSLVLDRSVVVTIKNAKTALFL
jgi:hypothetical protein